MPTTVLSTQSGASNGTFKMFAASVPIKDSEGVVIGAAVGDTEDLAVARAARLVACTNLFDGLPIDGILSGRFVVADADPKDPFDGPAVPPARFKSAIIELLHIEECLQNPAQYLSFEEGSSPITKTAPGGEDVENVIHKLNVRKRGLLEHLNRMLGQDFKFDTGTSTGLGAAPNTGKAVQ